MADSVYFLLNDEENFDKYETILQKRRKKKKCTKKNEFLAKEENCFSFFFFFFFEDTIKNYFRGYFQRIILVNRESRF